MLALLIDENLNHRMLRGLLRSAPHLDYKLAAAEELQGADDPKVLDFAAKHNLVPKYAYQRVKAGSPMPGVIAVPDDLPIGRAIEDLGILVECAAPSEIRSLVIYLPL